MARLPSANDLNRRKLPASSPGISVQQVDYSPLSQGTRAIGKGMDSIAAGLEASLEADKDVKDFETRKRLLDFRLETEMALEEHKRNMPAGGSGFAQSWNKEYRRRAQAFVGKNDANIPEQYRGQIGLTLKEHETRLSEAAQREEWGERDRSEVEGLEQTLGVTRSFVEADPSRRDEMRGEGEKLIEASRITPAAKDRLTKHFRKELDKTAIITRIMKAQSAEDFRALESDLAPNALDKFEAPSFSGQGGPAAVRYNNPGAMWPGPSSKKFGAVDSVTLNDGQSNKIAVFPDAVSGAAAQFDLLSSKYAGKSLADAIRTWSGGNSSEAYANKVARETGLSQGTVLTKDMLADPNIAVPLAKAMASIEAGKESYPLSDEQWAAAHRWAVSGEKPSGLTRVADADGKTGGGAYAGPYGNLTLPERKAFFSQVQAQRAKAVSAVSEELKGLESNALSGYTMPAEKLQAIGGKVSALADPELAARFDSALLKAQTFSEFQKRAPAANEIYLQRARAHFAANPPTTEDVKFLGDVEELVSKQRAMLETDKLTWSYRSGTVPVGPLDFNSDESMTARLEHAAKASAQFGGPMQYFTKAERESFQASLKAGGEGLLKTATRMASAWGPEHTTRAMAEISDKVPEAAIAGYLVANNINPQAATDIATSLQRRQDPNYRPNLMPRKDGEKVATEVLGDVYRNYPPQQRDAILNAADAVFEARIAKADPADAENIWRQALTEVIGQRSDPFGKVYGGPVSTEPSGYFFSGKGKSIMLPSTWRQDIWRETLEQATVGDLLQSGLMPPTDASGRPISMTKVANAKLVQIGPGQYIASLGDPDTPGQEKWVMSPPRARKSRQPFVLDFNRIEQVLRKKIPGAFWNG